MTLPLFATPHDSPPNSPLLALDLDDVLAATNAVAAECLCPPSSQEGWLNACFLGHSTYYEPISLNDFHYVRPPAETDTHLYLTRSFPRSTL